MNYQNENITSRCVTEGKEMQLGALTSLMFLIGELLTTVVQLFIWFCTFVHSDFVPSFPALSFRLAV